MSGSSKRKQSSKGAESLFDRGRSRWRFSGEIGSRGEGNEEKGTSNDESHNDTLATSSVDLVLLGLNWLQVVDIGFRRP